MGMMKDFIIHLVWPGDDLSELSLEAIELGILYEILVFEFQQRQLILNVLIDDGVMGDYRARPV
jgi:hypothetical protein